VFTPRDSDASRVQAGHSPVIASSETAAAGTPMPDSRLGFGRSVQAEQSGKQAKDKSDSCFHHLFLFLFRPVSFTH